MNVVEQQLCKRLADLLQGRLPGISIDGNWLPSATVPKGAEIWRGAKLDVTVGTRSYGEFTSRTAEMEVKLDGEFPVAADPSLDRSVAAYAEVVALLEEWHGDIAAVKRDLSLDGFDPVGLRLSGGTFELDRDTKVRYYSQTFAVRGRIVPGGPRPVAAAVPINQP